MQKDQIRKVLRFISIYGISRTLAKVIGRLRLNVSVSRRKHGHPVGVIGCGQFAYSTICYFLNKSGIMFDSCFDIDGGQANSLAHRYKFKHVADSLATMLEQRDLHTVYIASNHYTHTDYAIKVLKRNLNTYIEKPISVDEEQLSRLLYAVAHSQGRVFAGYNRPFSGAIRDFKHLATGKGKINSEPPFTISCYISGHRIAEDHWYRDPKEGTRICGNLGHWIDLSIHLLNWRGPYPDILTIMVSYSNEKEPDDNIAVTIVSDKHDLISIVLSSRSEPFEGINETINIQLGNVIAKIDDFRRMAVWIDDILVKRRYWPKDVGHKEAVMQPFGSEQRDWHEVELSTLLMLSIKDMVQHRETTRRFSTDEATRTLWAMRNGSHDNVHGNLS